MRPDGGRADGPVSAPERSRLGQILVGWKLISQAQLVAAIREQDRSGGRLGEILAGMKLVTEAQVRGAIRRQRNLRMAAALAGVLFGPLYAQAAAVAAGPAAVTAGERRLQPLPDEALSLIVGQASSRPQILPLTAEVEVSGVTYDPENAHARVNKDGSVTLRIPSTIGEISFRNIRVGAFAAADAPSFGSITLRDIDLTGTTVTIRPR